MKKALIYVRVSTDEQSEKGYSLQHQEERLRQYCTYQNIEVVGFYKEDHSAKTFERPAFHQLLAFLKKSRGTVDLLLFLKWDRFSRNAGDAYGMINQLNKLGVEPQAIEQPLDLNIPENKIMLAFYLAAPEVENDRRSLNVIAGMRRSIKEGRYCTVAPKGYRNIRSEDDKPIIVPGKDAHHVQWVFEEVTKGVHSVKDIWRMVKKRGFTIGRSNIWNMLRNPIYYGKIFLAAYKDEQAMLVKGIHEPLISEQLFFEAQDVLDGRKRKVPSKHTARVELPLRGFLKCRKCGANLTGSSSKGNGGKYFYYHCNIKCKERIPAELANHIFVEELQTISSNKESILLFEEVIKDHTKQSGKDKSKAIRDLQAEIEKNRQRISNAQQLMLDGELPAADYREIKNRYEPTIQKLVNKQLSLTQLDENLSDYLMPVVDLLRNLPEYYQNASLNTKQQLIGSIYPEKLIFENKAYRTTALNEVIALICRTGKGSDGHKKGQASICGNLSREVIPLGFKPKTF